MTRRSKDNAARTERAVMRYKDTVYGIAMTQLGSSSNADDAFQDVFMTHLTKAPVFTSDEHEKAWLIRTTINICRRYNVMPRFITVEDFSDIADRPSFDTEYQREVFDEVRALPEKYRMAIYLHYFEGMSTAACAEVLKISEAALRKRLSRGRELLHKRLECDRNETGLQGNKRTAIP